jgi:hypothetical protein
MKAGFRCVLAVSAILLIVPSVAAADTAASVSGGNLIVQANATGSNITITRTGATTFTVSDPAGNVTGTGPNCTPAGPTVTVTCQNVTPSDLTQSISVTGKDGEDTITLAPGTDVGASLVGGNGNDVLTGGTQTDVLEGREGNDTLNGGGGNDYLLPGYGTDHVDGGGGNDRIEQQSSAGEADVLGGGANDDSIWSQGGGTTQFDGGPGDDLLVQSVFTSGVPVVMSGGEGEDDATLGNGSGQGIAVSLDDQANDGPLTGGTSNVHSDVENLNTDSGPDVIVGSPGPNIIRSDTINFNGFLTDTAPGNDMIDPGGGVDYVFSGGGDDTIAAADQLGDTINCGSGPTASPDSDTAIGDSIDVLFSCENVTTIPPPDTTHPKVTLSARSISRRAFARRGLTVRLSADEPASFAVDLNAKVKRRGGRLVFPAAVGEATLGSGRLKLGSGTRSLRLKPSRKFARTVRNRRLRLVIRVTATDAAGNVTRTAKSVRVK